LSTFFPAYVFSRRFHDKHQMVAERAFLPAIKWAQRCNINRSRQQAQPNGASEIPILAMAEFFQKLTGPPPPQLTAKLRGHDPAIHTRMAKALLAHMAAHPRQIAQFVDLLPGFDFSECSQETLADITQCIASLLARKEIQTTHRKKLAAFQDALSAKIKKDKEKEVKKNPPCKKKRGRDEQTTTKKEADDDDDETPPAKRHADTEATVTAAAAETVTTKPTERKRRVVVVFAGFKGTDEPQVLAEKVRELEGEVRGEDDPLESTITHLVRPEGAVTTKTLVAALLRYWLVSPSWVDASLEAGDFVDEQPFGRRFPPNEGPLVGKKVAILDAYKREPRFNGPLHQTLIEAAGRGMLVADAAAADFTLVPRTMSSEERAALEAKTGTRTLSRPEFFKMLCP